MRRPEGTCASCWQPHPPSQERCFGPPEASERTYGKTTLDRLEAFLLDATNPRQDVATRAHGFQIDQAKTLARWLRSATADGSLTAADFWPAPPTQADRDNLAIDIEELGGTAALTDRILALFDAAATPSTPAEQPDPLPTMSGTAIARALHAGEQVEQWSSGETGCDNEPHWCALGDPEFWLDHIGDRVVVARIATPADPTGSEA